MATWIGHLRVAENLLGVIPDLVKPYFSIGSLAPDSGFPDENWEHFDPPSQVTHFKAGNSRRGTAIQNMDFFRRYSVQLATAYADRAEHSFLTGYYFHLLTDYL